MTKGFMVKWNKSLLSKLAATTVFVLLVPFIISNILTYMINYKAILNEYTASNRSLMATGIDRWKDYINTMENSSLVFYENTEKYEIWGKNGDITEQDEYKLREHMTEILNIDSSFRRIQISVFGGSDLIQEKLVQGNLKKWRLADELVWTDEEQKLTVGHTKEGEPAVLVFRKIVLDYPSSAPLLSMMLYCDMKEMECIADIINEKDLDENTADKTGDNNGIIGFFDRQTGKLLYSTGGMENVVYKKFGKGWIQGSLDGKNGFFFTAQTDYKGISLEIVKFIPEKMLLSGLYQTIVWLLLVQFLLFMLVLLFVFFVYYSMVRPIREIVANMKKVENGVYEYTSQVHGVDEIAVLDHAYEDMVLRINMLINQEYKNALEISRTRLKMLQAQIDPHFLNNMIQNISTKALKEGASDVYGLLTCLARIFQYNMDTSSDYVLMEQEITHITHYLTLQKERFRHSLCYEVCCTDEAKRMKIPKMILQPVVENSINHGIRSREETGDIRIHVWTDYKDETKMLHVEMTDNGVGITKEKIKEIKSRLSDGYTINSTQGHGIGLLNVFYRLELYTNGKFTWEIESERMKYTTVRFYIPEEEERL